MTALGMPVVAVLRLPICSVNGVGGHLSNKRKLRHSPGPGNGPIYVAKCLIAARAGHLSVMQSMHSCQTPRLG